MPSASGKTNLAMMRPPAALGERYEVEFYGDDIVWLRVDEADGRIARLIASDSTFFAYTCSNVRFDKGSISSRGFRIGIEHVAFSPYEELQAFVASNLSIIYQHITLVRIARIDEKPLC